MATRSQHGKHPIRVLFYGLMENVCCYPVFSLAKTDSFLYQRGREERVNHWVL